MTLDTIRPGVAFQQPAAASFRRMEAEAGRQLDANRTTDTWDEQLVYYEAYRASLNGGPSAPLALHPSETLHVYRENDPTSATAWDTDERGAWLDDHGWIADVPGEPWHREYRAHRDQYRFQATPVAEILNQLGEDSMFIAKTRTAWWLILPQGTGKPRAVVLAANSGAADTSIPILNFNDPVAEASLAKAVDGWQ